MRFAARSGLAMVENGYFTTERRVDGARQPEGSGAPPARSGMASEAEKHGTVGAVALDAQRQPRGRDLDRRLQQQAARAASATAPSSAPAPMRKNGVCAVSCTGQGEFFIRHAAAYDIAARMQYGGQTLQQATRYDRPRDDELAQDRRRPGGDRRRRATCCTPFNTLGMYRGWITTAGELVVSRRISEVHQLGSLPR